MEITLRSFVLASLVCAAGSAQAGFTSVAYLDGNYDATKPLQNGTVYFVTNSIEITGAYDGKSGLAVAPGAEVVIFVQEDCRLYVRGMDGETGGMGGGAGILCPSNSTLIITGPGHVQATGGGGTNGGGERWFDARGEADLACYATAGDTTLYASWSDTPGFNAADYRLDATGIGIDGSEVVIPFNAVNPANLDYALDFVKVRSSPPLNQDRYRERSLHRPLAEMRPTLPRTAESWRRVLGDLSTAALLHGPLKSTEIRALFLESVDWPT